MGSFDCPKPKQPGFAHWNAISIGSSAQRSVSGPFMTGVSCISSSSSTWGWRVISPHMRNRFDGWNNIVEQTYHQTGIICYVWLSSSSSSSSSSISISLICIHHRSSGFIINHHDLSSSWSIIKYPSSLSSFPDPLSHINYPKIFSLFWPHDGFIPGPFTLRSPISESTLGVIRGWPPNPWAHLQETLQNPTALVAIARGSHKTVGSKHNPGENMLKHRISSDIKRHGRPKTPRLKIDCWKLIDVVSRCALEASMFLL